MRRKDGTVIITEKEHVEYTEFENEAELWEEEDYEKEYDDNNN